MKMDKTRIGVSLCCAAALFGTVAYAVSPALAADTSGGGTSGTVLSTTPYTDVSDEKNDESGRMAGIKILSGGEYVSTVDSAMLASTDEEVVISGEIGESYIVGDLIFEIVSKEEVQAAAADDLTRASTKRWSIDLSGDSMSKDFEVTSSIPTRRSGSTTMAPATSSLPLPKPLPPEQLFLAATYPFPQEPPPLCIAARSGLPTLTMLTLPAVNPA